MPNSSYTQQALANDTAFQLRVLNALMSVAWQVMGEPTNTPNYLARTNYARVVLSQPKNMAAQLSQSVVVRPNVINFATSYDFEAGQVVTTAGDADLESQFYTDWNQLAGG